MDKVYIDKGELNSWVAKYFPNRDLISIDDLIGVIEDLDSELEYLKEEKEENDYPNEERDREAEILGL